MASPWPSIWTKRGCDPGWILPRSEAVSAGSPEGAQPALRPDNGPWRSKGFAALAAIVLASGALAGEHAPDRRSNAEMAGLTICLVDADVATATLAQMASGRPREEVERAVEHTLSDPAYREYVKRTVGAIYSVRPREPRTWLAQRLRACAGGASGNARAEMADSCYRLTRYAKDIYAQRDAKVPLDDALLALDRIAGTDGLSATSGESLKRLARTIYGSGTGVTQFRTGLFVSCVLPKAQ